MPDNNQNLEIRLLEDTDNIHDLTLFLNRAYKPLADMGLRYTATWQDDEITLKRINNAECCLGFINSEFVATVTFRTAENTKGPQWYSRPDVASSGQFAVKPEFQGTGIGSSMLEFVEKRARETGAAELALDTSEQATHLIEWYSKRGYRIIETTDWKVTNYISVILSKKL